MIQIETFALFHLKAISKVFLFIGKQLEPYETRDGSIIWISHVSKRCPNTLAILRFFQVISRTLCRKWNGQVGQELVPMWADRIKGCDFTSCLTALAPSLKGFKTAGVNAFFPRMNIIIFFKLLCISQGFHSYFF